MAERTINAVLKPLPDDLDPPFELGIVARDVYWAIRPLLAFERDTNYAWARLLSALCEPLDVIAEMVRDDAEGNPGWTALASPDRCPSAYLRVLAQWAGVRQFEGVPDADLRGMIGPRAPGWWAGTEAAMVAAVRRFFPADMAPSAVVFFQARADESVLGHPFLIRVFTYTYVPHDPEKVRRALWLNKPAGFLLEYEVQEGQAWFMLEERMASWGEVMESYASWETVLHDDPIGGSE